MAAKSHLADASEGDATGAIASGPIVLRRIAMTSYYLPSDSKIGVGWVAHRLANELQRRGHAVTMFSPSAQCTDADYEHVQIPLQGHFKLGKWAVACRRLDLSQFDALLAHGEDHLMRRSSTPAHIRTLHGSCFDEARHAETWIGRVRMTYIGLTELVAAARTPITVGVSKSSIRWFPWLSRVIPNGVDPTRFWPDPSAREASPTVLFVGTYERRKRGRLLAETFASTVIPAVPDAKLWMVCSDAPSAPGVEVLGRLSDAELAERYRRAWVFCLPSTYEGFGVPYAEALMSGTPIVATANLGAREVLQAGGGVIVDDDQLGTALIELLTDHRKRHRLAEQAEAASAPYRVERVAEAYERLISDLLDGAHA